MAIKDLRDEFMNASHGWLTLDAKHGCTFSYVDGPDGRREWQLLRFRGNHVPSHRKWVINPSAELDDMDIADRHILKLDPVPPLGDLYEACRRAATLVLSELAKVPAT
jgi:hypothetical protein